MSSKKFENRTTRQIRDEDRFYGFNTCGAQNPAPTLWGKAGKKRATEARIAGGRYTPYQALMGRRAHLQGIKSVPYNAEPPASMEETARLVGWLKAAEEVKSNWQARKVLKALYPQPGRGAGSPYNVGGAKPWLMIKKWASPSMVTEFAAKAVVWLAKWAPWLFEKATPRFLDKVGRLKPLTRFAAIHEFGHSPDRVSHREIRWDLVAKAQRGVRAALAFVPEHLLRNHASHFANAVWFELCGVKAPKACAEAGIMPWHGKLAVFKSLLATIDATSPEMVDAAWRLAQTFSSVKAVEQWVKKSQPNASSMAVAFHDAAQKLGVVKVSNGWEQLLLRAPAQAKDIVPFMKEIEAILGRAPKSLEEAKAVAEEHSFSALELTSRERQFLADNPAKAWEELPGVVLEQDGYTLKSVYFKSTELLTAGRLTDCCQHLDGAGAACARAAWVQPAAGIYAVCKGGHMIAQSFAWRSHDGASLVLDSVECKGSGNPTIVNLFVSLAKAVVGRLGIREVVVADGCSYGITRAVAARGKEEFAESKATPKCAFDLSYSDAKRGVVVLAQAKVAATVSMPAVKVATQVVTENFNVLSETSDVYCEYCEAQVHADCEICPSCGEDISEWVDDVECAE